MPKDLEADHRKNWLLAALEPQDLAALEPYLEVVELTRGQVLYEPGDPIRQAYFPHNATVLLVNVLEDGSTVEVAVFGREGVLGLLSALVTRESFGRYITHIPGTASRIAVEHLHEVRNTRPKLRQLIMHYGEALLGQTFQILTFNAVHPVEARCCRWILRLHDRADGDTLPLTHEFLAEMLGVQCSTLSAVLRTLQEAGLIQQGRGSITVANRAGLEAAACECYGKIRHIYERLLHGSYPPKARSHFR